MAEAPELPQPPEPILRFGCVPCSLGLALIAVRAEGLAAVLLGEQAELLEAELRRRFPTLTIAAAPASWAPLLAEVALCLERPELKLPLALAPAGTAFQRSVWKALTEIPPGQTISYGELARWLGAPRAVRAVAAACGANPLAVLVPCHRVIASDGALTGYRWGIERKRALLEREADARLPFDGAPPARGD